MNLKVRKSVIKYCIILIVYLAPSRIFNLFSPYSSYAIMLIQGGIGVFYFMKYKSLEKKNIPMLLLFFIASGFLGMVFNYNADVAAYGRYICWGISIIGLFLFISKSDEVERKTFLESSKIMFFVSYILTVFYWAQMTDNMAYGTSVFFWGSEAVTVQAFIMFFSLSLFYDMEYKGKAGIDSYIIGVASLLFCIANNSGQGISMFIVLIVSCILDYWLKDRVWEALKPGIVIISIFLLNYIIITLRFTEYEIIVNYITNVLSKDISLTGRDIMFSGVLEIFSKHPIIGYGYNNGIVNDILGNCMMQFNTAHNSMLQMLVDYGLFGTGIFALLIFNCLSGMRKFDYNKSSRILYFSVFSMFVGGLVNMIIPTNNFWIVLFFGSSNWIRNIGNLRDVNGKNQNPEMILYEKYGR